MSLDPELIPFLGGPDSSNMDDLEHSRQVQAELTTQAVAARTAPPAGLHIYDQVVSLDGSHDVTVRIYRRDSLPSVTGALVFVHGGAFVLGNLESEHERCVLYSQSVNTIVISVDYRLAPEYPYPAAHDDVWVVLNWVVEHADELGVDTNRICLSGNSAGGALAAGIALRIRDEGAPAIAAQMLLYPVLDDQGSSLSMTKYATYDPWDGNRCRKMWPLYLGSTAEAPPYAAPSRASDLKNLPTTFMMICEEDPLRDEELTFAQRLLDAGVSVELHHYRQTYHAFDVIAPQTKVGQRALNDQLSFLGSVIG